MMRKMLIIFAVLLMNPNGYAGIVSFTGKVTYIEPTYLPETVAFSLDNGDSTCGPGAMLLWNNPDIDNNKAVYSTLLTALVGGKTIRFHYDSSASVNINNRCTGTHLHILKD